jgi:hypothetical protein
MEDLHNPAIYLSELLNEITGKASEVTVAKELPTEGIYLTLTDEDDNLGNEGYLLTIGKRLISIKQILLPVASMGYKPCGRYCR